MSHIDRRKFLTLTASAAGTLFLPLRAWPAILSADPEPRFFLQIFFQGGADPTYLYDGRSLALTAAGKIQNYNGVEPTPYTGVNGGTCLLPPSSKALAPFLDRFSIVNGVVMTPTFDGHTQNTDFYFTGSPFGGESFLPYLNAVNPLPVDGIQNGFFFGDLTNHGNVIPLDASTLALLVQKLSAGAQLDEGSEAYKFIHSRFAANAAGGGRFSAAAAKLLAGLEASGDLKRKLFSLASMPATGSPEEQFTQMIGSVFRNNVSRSAFWILGNNYDTHGADSAKAQPKNFADVTEKLATVFRLLASSPYDAKRSLLDVTTVVVNSEFSRTMRQDGQAIDKTGTDHNQLNNSFLIGGRGIRGGQVIGASDFSAVGETLSPSHLSYDPTGLKMMGRPFDFSTGLVRSDLPAQYDANDYLTAGSVVNTVLSLFDVPKAKMRTLDRNGTLAPVIKGLIQYG